jgi:hypothetical protein
VFTSPQPSAPFIRVRGLPVASCSFLTF